MKVQRVTLFPCAAQWGSASDNARVYVSNNNYHHNMTEMIKPAPGSNPSGNGGMLWALNAWDGSVAWSFANPTFDKDDSTKNARSQVC